MSIIKPDLLYTKSHEWVAAAAGLARIGITDHARCELGDLVFAEALPVGRQIQAGQAIGALESVKIAADIMSPVSGEIVATWPDLGDSLDQITQDPYSVWFVEIRMSLPDQLEALMDADAYEAFLAAGS